MARNYRKVCCDSCGRDCVSQKPPGSRFCNRCAGTGSQLSEERGRKRDRTNEWLGHQCEEDDYGEESDP